MSSRSEASPRLRVLDLCADDFGLTFALSQAVARLAAEERLSSTSCITNSPHWEASARLLRGLPASVESGLHFNLTEGAPLSEALARIWPRLPGLSSLMAAAHLRRLPLAAIEAEWRAQLQAYTQAVGQAPKHVDGHQHVHHLPGVREVLLAGIARLPQAPGLRDTGRVLGPGFAIKRWLIAHTGGTALARALKRRGWPRSPALLGCYDFEAEDYRALMRAWLGALPAEGGLLFCHPGPNEPGDAIAAARVREAAYLGSDDFPRDLQEAGVRLGRSWLR